MPSITEELFSQILRALDSLGIKEVPADFGEIKKLYHKLMLLYHPDSSKNRNISAAQKEELEEKYHEVDGAMKFLYNHHEDLQEKFISTIEDAIKSLACKNPLGARAHDILEQSYKQILDCLLEQNPRLNIEATCQKICAKSRTNSAIFFLKICKEKRLLNEQKAQEIAKQFPLDWQDKFRGEYDPILDAALRVLIESHGGDHDKMLQAIVKIGFAIEHTGQLLEFFVMCVDGKISEADLVVLKAVTRDKPKDISFIYQIREEITKQTVARVVANEITTKEWVKHCLKRNLKFPILRLFIAHLLRQQLIREELLIWEKTFLIFAKMKKLSLRKKKKK